MPLGSNVAVWPARQAQNPQPPNRCFRVQQKRSTFHPHAQRNARRRRRR